MRSGWICCGATVFGGARHDVIWYAPWCASVRLDSVWPVQVRSGKHLGGIRRCTERRGNVRRGAVRHCLVV